MKLSEEQSRTMQAKHAVCAKEACDGCGRLLGPVRHTRLGEPGEWCSRECRNGADEVARSKTIRKGGRPRRHANAAERQRAYRRRRAASALEALRNPLASC